MNTKRTVWVILAAAVIVLGARGAGATSIITSPYSGEDLLHMYTDPGPHDQSYSGGISTPGAGTVTNPAGVTYLKYGGDQTTTSILDGAFTGNKFFMGAGLNYNNPASTATMDSNAPTGNWLWWDAHFTTPEVITHFVIRTADAASARTPDQFQLRGSNDGGATWTVIYRLNANGDGADTPWGANPPNYTAVQFDGGGVDFAAPVAYSEVRLEIFSCTNNGDGVGITEWQLAGTAGSTTPPWPDYLPGDFNKDGQVGPEDFGILKDQFGNSNLAHGSHESWTLGDANDDGQIGPEDFGLLKDSFGLSNGPTGTYPLANVPEPATLALLALGGLAVIRKRRARPDVVSA